MIEDKDELLKAQNEVIGILFEVVKKLQENKVEVRPMICGSMGTQPFYVKEFGELKLPNVTIIDEYGFYVPNNPKLTREEVSFISGLVNEIINE